MRIFKHRSFHHWAESEGLTNNILRLAIDEMSKGLYEANLGSGLYKKRVALQGKGKRGSHRTLIAFRKEERAFFVYDFSKNVRANVDAKEEKIYRQFAKYFLNADEKAIKKMIENGALFEVK